MDFALTHMPMLEVYAKDGRVEIDNNPVENSIRTTAIGKKNWLLMSDATFCTLIGNGHPDGLNAEVYLRDRFTRLPTQTNRTVHRLTPKDWAAE